ncbi:hypothetical protein FRC09_017625 [Ceratobasidium sp. 395]|nr:hypothetical protein FRC09_017625 [Ceratobasidium sp. 395]
MPSGPAHRPVTTARTTRARSRRDDRQTRPRPPPHWFTLGSFRSIAHRLRHPPPRATTEEHYFMFVAPRYKISFEDVVADKHLPPLSLQDFEDYLHHVEGTPENLYFLLWVRHYRRAHGAWAESVLPTIPSSSKGTYRSRDLWERLAPCQDRQLKDEFVFAKSTFFDEHSPMRLDIPDELRRKVLHIRNMPPAETHVLTDKLPSFPQQPEPGHFDAVVAFVETRLRAAFDRFILLAFRNSGLWHSCIGHLVGVGVLASGLALWCTGIARGKGRAYVAASLPIIWMGVWFMLVSLNGHCLGVYVTGDARQLYPHEFVRPVPPDADPPPVYSIARTVDAPCPPSSYVTSRRTSGASGTLLPVTSLPRRTFSGVGRRKSEGGVGWWRRESRGTTRRLSEGLIKMFGGRRDRRRDADREACSVEEGSTRTTEELEARLPPARKTKGLPRDSFALDVLSPMEGPALPPSALTAARRGGVAGIEWGPSELEAGQYKVSFRPEERPDSPGDFSEENDFGIIVSEAFNEDEPYAYTPALVIPPMTTDNVSATHESTSGPTTAVEPVSPVGPGAEYLAQRRMTMPDIFAPAPTDTALEWVLKEARRQAPPPDSGSAEGGGGSGSRDQRMWPWPRRLLGPMTIVHSPIVRRAHWEVTVRTAIVALVVTAGMALGLIG